MGNANSVFRLANQITSQLFSRHYSLHLSTYSKSLCPVLAWKISRSKSWSPIYILYQCVMLFLFSRGDRQTNRLPLRTTPNLVRSSRLTSRHSFPSVSEGAALAAVCATILCAPWEAGKPRRFGNIINYPRHWHVVILSLLCSSICSG